MTYRMLLLMVRVQWGEFAIGGPIPVPTYWE